MIWFEGQRPVPYQPWATPKDGISHYKIELYHPSCLRSRTFGPRTETGGILLGSSARPRLVWTAPLVLKASMIKLIYFNPKKLPKRCDITTRSLAWAVESRTFSPEKIVLENTAPESGMSQ